MNGHTAARLSTHAVSRIVDAIALERAGKPAHKVGDYWRDPQRQDQLSRTSSARADLRGGSAGVVEVWRRSGNPAIDPEGEAMKQRLLKHALIAVCFVLAAVAANIVINIYRVPQ